MAYLDSVDIATIIGGVGVLVPVWLRCVDFIIHRYRRYSQAKVIRRIVSKGLKSIRGADVQRLKVKSTDPGRVGRRVRVDPKDLDNIRFTYFQDMNTSLALVMEDFSGDLSPVQKGDIRSYLSYQQDFISKWMKTRRNRVPTLDIYEKVVFARLNSIEWLRSLP